MLNVDAALAVIGREVRPVAPVMMPLGEARGCVLAEPVVMDVDAPPFDRSQLDGFAVRSAECQAGAELEIIGQADAGGGAPPALGPGQCVAINTGAMMPAGADGVLMVEHSQTVARAGGRFIKSMRGVAAGYGVQRRGADAAAGAVVLQPGRRLGAAALAVCATAGLDRVLVRRVRAALLTTGDELVAPRRGEALAERKIRNSNHPMLGALLRDAGAAVVDLGTCGDVAATLRERLERGLAQAELLLISGGMSMGTRDLVPPLLRELGVDFHIEKVRMKPGKPFIFGTRDSGDNRKYVAGLPGNPVSAFVTFQRFVTEVMRRMAGEEAGAGIVEARTATALPVNGEREFYQPCVLRQAEGKGLVAEALPWKGSADLFTLASADGLVVRAAHASSLEAGSPVRILLTNRP